MEHILFGNLKKQMNGYLLYLVMSMMKNLSFDLGIKLKIMVQLILFKEFKTKYSTIKIVSDPIEAIEIRRQDGTYFIPIEEFLKTKKNS